MKIRPFLHRSPRLRLGAVHRDGHRRRARHLHSPHRPVPGNRPAHRHRHRQLPRRQRQGGRRDRRHAHRSSRSTASKNMLYMSSQSTNDGNMKLTVTFKLGTNLDIAQVQVQNRVRHRPARSCPSEVRQTGVTVKKSLARHHPGRAALLPRQPLRRPSTSATTPCSRCATSSPASQGVGDLSLFGARDYSMRLWLNPDQSWRRANMTASDVVTAIQEQNVQVAAGVVGRRAAAPRRDRLPDHRQRPGPPDRPGEFADIIVKTGASGRMTRVRDVARVELGAADYSVTAYFNGQPAVAHRDLPAPRLQLHRHRQRDLRTGWRSSRRTSRRASTTRSPTTRPSSSASRIHDVVKTLFEAIVLVVHRGAGVPPELAGHARPAAGHAGLARRHVRRHGGVPGSR